jgi:hypothetical protein
MESDKKQDEKKICCEHVDSLFSCQTENPIRNWTGNRMWKRKPPLHPALVIKQLFFALEKKTVKTSFPFFLSNK